MCIRDSHITDAARNKPITLYTNTSLNLHVIFCQNPSASTCRSDTKPSFRAPRRVIGFSGTRRILAPLLSVTSTATMLSNTKPPTNHACYTIIQWRSRNARLSLGATFEHLNRVFAMYQILLGWKTYHCCHETDEPPNPRPTQPKKK